MLLNQGVDGVVIAGAAGSSEALRAQADAQGIPVVFASRASYLDDADTVRPDNMQAAQLLTEYLIRQGHQRIARLGGQSASLTPRGARGRLLRDVVKIRSTVSQRVGRGMRFQSETGSRKYYRAVAIQSDH